MLWLSAIQPRLLEALNPRDYPKNATPLRRAAPRAAARRLSSLFIKKSCSDSSRLPPSAALSSPHLPTIYIRSLCAPRVPSCEQRSIGVHWAPLTSLYVQDSALTSYPHPVSDPPAPVSTL